MNEKNDTNIQYWIFELNMPAQVKACIDAICKTTGRSSGELFQETIRGNLKQFEEDPDAYRESIRKFIGEERQHPLGIEVIRCYPVYVGETEEEAQDRHRERDNTD